MNNRTLDRDQQRRLAALLGRPLSSEDADELKRLASALGVRLEWTRVLLNPPKEGEEG